MKKIWNVIKPMVYSYTIQYFIIIIVFMIYSKITNQNISLMEQTLFYKIVIITISVIIIPTCIYLFKKFHRLENTLNYKKLLIMIPLGINISLFYNMLTLNLKAVTESININIYIIIFYTGILGPIFEETVYRYITLNRARDNYSEKTSIILTTILFAIMHSGYIGIIYGFIIGLLLIYVYKKYNNIAYPILVHISANITSIFIKETNIYLLIISAISLLLIILLIQKQKQ